MKKNNETATNNVHLLQDEWVWSYKPTIVYKLQSAADWMSDYRPLVKNPIQTVEQFWSVYDHTPSLASLDFGNIYAVFRSGILPVWEHPANVDGYSIIFYLNKSDTTDYVTRLYQSALLILIGNNFSFSSDLNGCTLERKTGGNKIVFWMSSAPGFSERIAVAKQILHALGVSPSEVMVSDGKIRIDWKEPKCAKFKLAVMTRLHKERANEPPAPRYNNSERPKGRPSSSRSRGHHHHRGRYNHQHYHNGRPNNQQ